MLNKRNRIKPKFQVNDSIRTVDIKRTFSKGDATIWSYNLYKITENNNDTIPNCRIENLKERYNEALLKKTESTMKENKDIMKALKLN